MHHIFQKQEVRSHLTNNIEKSTKGFEGCKTKSDVIVYSVCFNNTIYLKILEIMKFCSGVIFSLLSVMVFALTIQITTQSCRVQPILRTVDFGGCQVSFVVTACRGSCLSEEIHLGQTVSRKCNCCRSVGRTITKAITHQCSTKNPTYVTNVTKCACVSCSTNAGK